MGVADKLLTKNSLYMLAIFVLGVILAHFSTSIASCHLASQKALNANRGILAISVIAMTLSLSYVVCHMRCNCGGALDVSGIDTMWLMVFMLILGIILTSLSGVVKSEIRISCPSATSSANNVMILGVIMLVLSIGYLGWSGYDYFSKKRTMGGSMGGGAIEMKF